MQIHAMIGLLMPADREFVWETIDVPVVGVYDVTIGLEGGGHCLRPLLYASR